MSMNNRVEALMVPEDGRFTVEQVFVRVRQVESLKTWVRLLFSPWRRPLDTDCMEYKILDGNVYCLRLSRRK